MSSDPPLRTAPLCLLCGGALGGAAYPHDTAFAGTTYRFAACHGCGAHCIAPLPGAGALAAMYAPGAYHDQFYAQDGRAAHGAMMALLVRHLPAGARVLDYGCGNGDFLRAAAAAGFVAQGAEFGAAAAAASVRAGVPVHDLTKGDWPPATARWDAVHFGDVLEHLTDPGASLARMMAHLPPGGLVAAQGPLELQASLVGAATRLNGAVKHRLGGMGTFTPWHLTYTNARAQRGLFARAGLRELHWQVHEDGWPYAGQHGLRGAIAGVAIMLARLPGLRGRLGNRFTALYRKG